MNIKSAQLQLDELVADIGSVLKNNPSSTTCVWWRGYLSGKVSTLKAFTDPGDLDYEKVESALEWLYETQYTALDEDDS